LGLQPTAAGVVAAPIASAKPQPKPEPVWAHARIVLGDAFTTSAVPNANLLHALDAAALSECYRVALRDGNAPLEPLELRLDIETDQVGHITLATLHGAELPKGLRSCIAQAARTGSVDVKTFGRITGSVPLRFAPR
jgi:hypothetical protein